MIGAPRRSFLVRDSKKMEREVEFVDVGELMSRTHCFAAGNIVYHFAIIDYL